MIYSKGWILRPEVTNGTHYYPVDSYESHEYLAAFHRNHVTIYKDLDSDIVGTEFLHKDYFTDPSNPLPEEIVLWELELGVPFPPQEILASLDLT